jgi:RING finger and CHY zinc finger domain-containing protein 1
MTDYGCVHYKRNCKIVAPCCNEIYYCRLCHDDDITNLSIKNYHTINRFDIIHIVCAKCDLKQNISNKCINCEIIFGQYYCEICRLYDNINKGQFHCFECGFCRINKDTSYHCKICKICLNISSKDNHECTEQHELECMICYESLFTTTKSVCKLKCNHSIHNDCLSEYIKTNYKCPLCSKSIIDLTEYNKYMENLINMYDVPDVYKNIIVKLLCNECNVKFNASYNMIGYKCTNCKSYNTSQI